MALLGLGNLTPGTKKVVIICGSIVAIVIIAAAVYTGTFGDIMTAILDKKE